LDLFSNYQNFFPWVAFLAGLGGSLHCVGMCGGLVTNSCQNSQDVMKYQMGRLIGYLIVGLIAGLIGQTIALAITSPLLNLIPGLMIGILFLYWGFQNYYGKKAELPMPAFMGKFYSFIWRNLVYKKNHFFSQAFFTGLISIFLPCGLLYGIALGAMASQHPLMAIGSMLAFWLGTIPSMALAPALFHKLISPFKAQLPKTYAISLILIGLLTVSFRIVKFNELNELKKAGASAPAIIEMCH
jgi:sulfite exporter TauE/SafE